MIKNHEEESVKNFLKLIGWHWRTGLFLNVDNDNLASSLVIHEREIQ